MTSSFADGPGRLPYCTPAPADSSRSRGPGSMLRRALTRIGLPLLLFVGMVAPLQAQDSQAVARGVSWLQGQVLPDGSLASEAESIAAPHQARAETAATLKLLATVPPALTASLAGPVDGNTEFLARQVIAQAQAGSRAADALAQLAARQNRDGGYGGAYSFASNPLDTAWTMMALHAAGTGDAANTARALTYLLGAQAPTGGFGMSYDAPRAGITAVVTSALQVSGASPAAVDAINRASAWLQTQQAADGGWGSVSETAGVYLALLGSGSDSGLQASARSYLLARQGADGAWNSDPYETALALRALVAQPRAVPTTGSVMLRVLDSATGQPLAGASAILGGPLAPAMSDASGNISFRDVPAGNYNVLITAPGYGSATRVLALRAGTTADLGAFGLAVAPTSGLLKGLVKDGATGAALADAAVNVTGSATAAVLTGADGSYHLAGLAPGAVSITIAKTGYTGVSASATMVAGAALVFSPTLSREGQSGASTATLSGRAVDATSLAPLAGVSVSLDLTGATVQTGADGRFTLAGVTPGTYAVSFARAGYTSQVFGAVLVTAGSAIDFQTVGLGRALTTVALQGKVTDLHTGQPVPMATVALSGSAVSVQTDSNGNYRMEGLAPGAASLRFSASGYAGETVSTTFASAGAFRLDKTLALDGGANPRISAFVTDLPVYSAYAPVSFRIDVANASTEPVSGAVVDVTVFGPQGQVVNFHEVIRLDANGVAQNQFTFAPNSSAMLEAKWSTQAYPPGTYQVKSRISLENAATGSRTVLAERSTAFTIAPTRNLLRLSVTPLPGFTTFEATEQLRFKVEASNQSNEAFSVPFRIEFKNPAGVLLHSEEGSVALEPNDVLGSVVTGPFAHRFAASGIYPVLVSSTAQVPPQIVAHGQVQVAPGIRVDAVQQVTPSSVTPDGDKRIRIQLQLKGVEQK